MITLTLKIVLGLLLIVHVYLIPFLMREKGKTSQGTQAHLDHAMYGGELDLEHNLCGGIWYSEGRLKHFKFKKWEYLNILALAWNIIIQLFIYFNWY